MHIGHCPGCNRDFMKATMIRLDWDPPSTICRDHCGPVCCRKMGCRYTKPHRENARLGKIPLKRCIVCGAHGDWFERFAPCVSKPVGSPRGTPGCERTRTWMGYGMQYACYEHHSNKKERFHVKYCSLKCYNSWDYGHRARAAVAQRRRWMRVGKQQRDYRKEKELAGGRLY